MIAATIDSLVRVAAVAATVGWAGNGAISSQSDPADPMPGILLQSVAVPAARASHECLELAHPDETILAPHGDTRVSTQCEMVEYKAISGQRWSIAQYRWTVLFTAEDKAKPADARDTITTSEVVLFERMSDDALTPVWHARFETGDYAVYRSIVPDVAVTSRGTVLLSIESCVNGTGGCGQEFAHRHADGRWVPVQQLWKQQLPEGFVSRIRHGVRIDLQTLRGEMGFYGERDPNCCPSHELVVNLSLRGDALVLRSRPQVRRLEP